jgi:hypothetical protein
MPKFYTKKFEKEVAAKIAASKYIQKKAYIIAKQRAESARKEMVDEFDSHPVTREINSGVSATNFSGTLGGYGNLFSFIGFPIGSQPTRPIKDYLKRSVRLHGNPKVIKSHKDLVMKFKVKMPKISEIELLSPSPWEGRSWTRGIERGITGLGSYMFSLHEGFRNSRSGKAVQGSKQIRAMAYRPVRYITSILRSLDKKIQ